MYKVHRHIDMKHVVIDIYKQNSSTLFFFFFFKMSDTLLSFELTGDSYMKTKTFKSKNFSVLSHLLFLSFLLRH